MAAYIASNWAAPAKSSVTTNYGATFKLQASDFQEKCYVSRDCLSSIICFIVFEMKFVVVQKSYQ